MRLFQLMVVLFFVFSCNSNTQGGDTCGDGVVDIGEDCDSGEFAGQSCQTLGYYGGEVGCNSDCTINMTSCEAAGRCGDGVVDLTEGEECDGSDLNEESCASLEPGLYHDEVGGLACNANCTYDLSGCLFCGDGVLNGPEECDGADLGGLTCADVSANFYEGAGALGCSEACGLVTDSCQFCGDGAVNGTELCDGTALGSLATCEEQGFPGGTPSCNGECSGVSYESCHTWLMLTSGEDHTCGVNDVGQVYCWGRGALGRLGTGNETGSPVPVPVSGLTDAVVDISAGKGFTCAVTAGGLVYCWGENLYGKLGTGDTTDHFVPTLIDTPLSDFLQVSAGEANACAVRATGEVQCWGSNESANTGRCSVGGNHLSPAPVLATCPATSLMNVVQVAVGYNHACALTNATGSHHVVCWGGNFSGQLGVNGTSAAVDHATYALRTSQSAMATEPLIGAFVSIGALHSCAIDNSYLSQVWCWGNAGSGRLGYDPFATFTVVGNRTQKVVARMGTTVDFTGVAEICTGELHTIALTVDGTPYAWGSDSYGQAGIGGSFSTYDAAVEASLLVPLMPIASLTAGYEHSCLVTSVGEAYCFGNNVYGQLGDGTTTSSATPVRVVFY